jgi:hypothetical protein
MLAQATNPHPIGHQAIESIHPSQSDKGYASWHKLCIRLDAQSLPLTMRLASQLVRQWRPGETIGRRRLSTLPFLCNLILLTFLRNYVANMIRSMHTDALLVMSCALAASMFDLPPVCLFLTVYGCARRCMCVWRGGVGNRGRAVGKTSANCKQVPAKSATSQSQFQVSMVDRFMKTSINADTS